MAGESAPVFRFAPSPNGLLHRGHAFSALLNRSLARRTGGRLLLRIEDIDLARCSEANVTAMLDDLRWLGVRWDGPVRRQSRHFADYAAAAEKLLARGLLYRCYASRTEIAAADLGRDPDGAPLRHRACPVLDLQEEERRREAGEPFALRLDMQRALAACANTGERLDYPVFSRAFPLAADPMAPDAEHRLTDPARWGDVVIVRKDAPTSYHLSVVVDDALQGVTHVVRGRDLEAATDVHRLLQALLGLPVPAYHHHELVRDDEGEKLGKSRGSRSLRALREAGVSRAEIVAGLGFAEDEGRSDNSI